MNSAIYGIIICICFSIIGIRTEKRILNPITVFCMLWGIIIFLSNLRLYTLYEADIYIYTLILLGIIFYILGYYVWKIASRNKAISFKIKSTFNNLDNYGYKLRYKLVYVLCIICILFLIKDIISLGVSAFSQGINLKEIQRVVRATVKNRSNIENAISFLVVNPFYTALCPITAIDFWIGKRDKKLLLLTITILLAKMLSTGGREPFIKFFFCMIVGYTFFSKRNNEEKDSRIKNKIRKNRRLFCFILFLTVVTLGILSFSRSGQNMIKTIYLDFAMQPNMLEYWAHEVDIRNLYGYGFASMNGFFYSILYCLKNLMILPDIPELYSQIYSVTMATDSQWVKIGSEISANAYVSVFWFLYYDAREIGIIIGMFLYGIIARWSYSFAMHRKSTKSICIYSIILVGIFYTFGRMEFTTTNYSLAFLFIYFIAYKKHIKVEIK